ncbi:MAG: hypothetical protein QOG03_2192 [Actinomycetota bacterium]|jgi:pimeloyl-ACP methyl ester carboxylesterase|nr:hypothetical protein [Actinomycetota bacterium]
MAPTLRIVDRPGPGPLVVMVHGSMDRAASFFKAADHLRDLHVILYDRRGYGRSVGVRPPPRGVDDHVEDLMAIVDSRPAVVAGHSYGGLVGLAAGVRHPDLIRAVAAFEAPMPWMEWWPKNTAGGAVQSVVSATDAGDAAEAFMRRMLGNERWESLPDRTREARRREGPTLVAELTTIRQPPPPFSTDDLTFPVVIGHGGRSLPHHQDAARFLAGHIPQAELVVIDGAQHGAHASHPAAFAGFVRRAVALSGLPATSTAATAPTAPAAPAD